MKRFSVLLVILVILATSCTTFVSKGLNFGAVPTNVDRRDYFEEKVWVHKFLGDSAGRTLGNISQDSTKHIVDEICLKILAKYPKGSAIEDLEITQEANFGQLLINWITLTIYAPSYVRVKGYVVVPRTSSTQAVEQANITPVVE